MTCSPSQIVVRDRARPARERIRTRLTALLARLGRTGSTADVAPCRADDALATALMDAYRVTRDPDVFEGLIEWARPQLRGRLRARLRRLGAKLDVEEVWQDTIVNIYRYPDRFLATRAGAFAAWSSTIADNAIRRTLRRSGRDAKICLQDPELLRMCADDAAPEPSRQVAAREECAATSVALGLVLRAYLVCFEQLSARERKVLQMVEVGQMRYAEIAPLLAVRADALKMVVFRARKRLHERLQRMLSGAPAASTAGAALEVAAPAAAGFG
jgi:RNA polymerase sigma factor (sigma-70 family)